MGEPGNDRVLNFVAGEQNNDISALDGDLFSWMFMNGDLFSAGNNGGNTATSALSNPASPQLAPLSLNVPNTEAKSVEVKRESSRPPRRKKSTLSTVSSLDGDSGNETLNMNDPEYEKKKKRLEKNREIARNCRKRKRERMSALENEVVRLREWNRQLELKLNQGKEGKDREDLRIQEMQKMKRMLAQNGNEKEMRSKMISYAEMYSDFGRERKAAINFHLSKLKSLLLPNQVSKMTLWSLQQDDEFYDEKKNQKTFGGGIWNMITEACRLSPEQKKKLIEMRGQVRQQRSNLAECLKILDELENRISGNFSSLSQQMQTLMSVTTPSQQARFLLWIEENQACMHMLNNLWSQKDGKVPGAPPMPGVVSEEVPTSSSQSPVEKSADV